MKLAPYVLLCGLNVYAIVQAAEVNVYYEDGSYFFYAKFEVEAPPERVMNVLMDYENLADLNPAIQTSEKLNSPDSSMIRVRTVVHDCILFFCKNIVRVEDVLQHENKKLEAFLIPMLSDLRSGYAAWELQQNTFSTTVTYNADMQPKFWAPPFIRSYVLTKKFKRRVLETVSRIQEIAKQNEK